MFPVASDCFVSRRHLLRLIWGVATLPLPSIASAGFNFFLSEYSATRAELQAALSRRFPLQKRTRTSSP
jgi:hypothetical protein